MSSSDLLIVIGSCIWTACLWFVAEKTTHDIPSNTNRLCLLLLCIFVAGSFSKLIIDGSPYLYSYLFFFSALTITMFTDMGTMLISRLFTMYSMPIGWFLSNLGYLPITPFESIGGSILGLFLLWIVRNLSHYFLKKEGLGQGDVDLLAFIGSFTGVFGCWITLLVGSLLGSIAGLFYFFSGIHKENMILPFGLFLSVAAILYVFYERSLIAFFLPTI